MWLPRPLSHPLQTWLRAALPLVAVLLCGQCARAAPPPGPPPASGGREGYVDAGAGVRLFYRTVGTHGDPVVVLHGGPFSGMGYIQADLEPLAAHHVLLFYDQRGSGRSTLVSDPAGLDAQHFVDDLEAVREHFGLDALTLLGHSWGPALAALYAARYPGRVERLLMVNPMAVTHALETQAFSNLYSRFDDATLDRLQELESAYHADPADADACRAYWGLFFSAALADPSVLQRSRGDFCDGSPDDLGNRAGADAALMASLGAWDFRPALTALSAPTLVMHGEMDPVPLASSREWAMALPNARLLVLERTGHFSYLEAPERFFHAARSFLRGEWPAGAEVVREASP